MSKVIDTQQLRMKQREECLILEHSLKFRKRIFCNLGTKQNPFYIKEIPTNCPEPDLEEMKSYEPQMEKNPDSYLSCTFNEHTGNHQETHELGITYHETGLQKVLDEIEVEQK